MKEEKCTTGPTDLFNDVDQCPNKPTKYLFTLPYCDKCYDIMVAIHARLNK